MGLFVIAKCALRRAYCHADPRDSKYDEWILLIVEFLDGERNCG